MNKTIKAALIKSGSTIIAAIIGIVSFNIGKNVEQKNIQNQIDKLAGDVINITGSSNITINNVSDLTEEYLRLLDNYTTLQNSSLVMADNSSTITFYNSNIIDYGNNNYNEIQDETSFKNENLQSADSTQDSIPTEWNDMSIEVSCQTDPEQSINGCLNVLFVATTSFIADHVTISVISNENEKISFNMHGELNHWYSNVNFYVEGEYEITITAFAEEKSVIYNVPIYVHLYN